MAELIVRTRDSKPNIIGITEVKPKLNLYKSALAEFSLTEEQFNLDRTVNVFTLTLLKHSSHYVPGLSFYFNLLLYLGHFPGPRGTPNLVFVRTLDKVY
jgi:hypothetical protein